MAFCSYFKIQPVAGGADRIKKSEWKLVSHDNSQPPRERQLLLLPLPLLLLLLSPDSSFPSPTASASLYLSASSIRVSNYVSVSFLGSPRTVLLSFPLTLCYSFSLHFSLCLSLSLSSFSFSLAFFLSPHAHLLAPRLSQSISCTAATSGIIVAATIAIAIVNRFKYDSYIYVYIYVRRVGREYRRVRCTCWRYKYICKFTQVYTLSRAYSAYARPVRRESFSLSAADRAGWLRFRSRTTMAYAIPILLCFPFLLDVVFVGFLEKILNLFASRTFSRATLYVGEIDSLSSANPIHTKAIASRATLVALDISLCFVTTSPK